MSSIESMIPLCTSLRVEPHHRDVCTVHTLSLTAVGCTVQVHPADP